MSVSSEWLGQLLDRVPCAAYGARDSGVGVRITRLNGRLAGLLGYSAAEATGHEWWEARVHPEDVPAAALDASRLLADGVVLREYRFRHEDGGYRTVRDELRLLPEGGDWLALGTWSLRHDAQDAEASLRNHLYFMEQLLEAIPAPVFFKDEAGRYLGCNKAFEAFLRMPKSRIVGCSVYDIAPKELADIYYEADAALFASPEGVQIYESTVSDAQGRRRNVVFNKANFFKPDGSLGGLVGVILDITDRKQAEERLRLAANALENTVEGVMITDEAGEIVSVNKAFSLITGYEAEEALGRKAGDVGLSGQDEALEGEIARILAQAGYWQGEIWRRRKNGELYPELLSISAVRDDAGKTSHFVSVFNDISPYKQYEEWLEFLAHHDPLTRLPNRMSFQERLKEAIARAHRHEASIGVLFIDLDGFKTVNDSLGHAMGDTLLQSVAARLTECAGEGGMVARLGGDEFVVMLDEIGSSQEAAAMAQRQLESLARPLVMGGHELFITASIGISCFPQDGRDAQTLLKNADVAMYRAKAQSRNAYEFFSAEMNAHAFETLFMANSLHRALERDELMLHYQPRVTLASGHVTGVEALLRWQHPDLGLIPPSRFIALAEETGIIVAIGDWVLVEACRQAAEWVAKGLPPVRVAVNLSPRQLNQGDLPQRIRQVLAEAGLSPSRLELEITESMMMQDPDRTKIILDEIKALGCAIAVDDFGTGYSSLSYLKRFPIDRLKIDQSFTGSLPSSPDSAAITRAIIAMAKSLNLHVTAEGIETQAQHRFLSQEGCDEGQGYLFSRPLPAPEVAALLAGSGGCSR